MTTATRSLSNKLVTNALIDCSVYSCLESSECWLMSLIVMSFCWIVVVPVAFVFVPCLCEPKMLLLVVLLFLY